MEAQNLADHIGLIRNDIKEMREELRRGLEQRVTHAELNGFHELYKQQLKHLAQRIGGCEEDLQAIHTQLRDEQNNRKRALYGGIATVAAAVLGAAILYALGIPGT